MQPKLLPASLCANWLIAQIGADDCQRVPGLKCLLLRKVSKSNRENFGDLRLSVLKKLPHSFAESRGLHTFANGSCILCGHFQNESDIDAYLGLEYPLIGIEEATTLSAPKNQDITACCRTSRSDWRPRIYSTANPGGVGHAWYKAKFINPPGRVLSPKGPPHNQSLAGSDPGGMSGSDRKGPS